MIPQSMISDFNSTSGVTQEEIEYQTQEDQGGNFDFGGFFTDLAGLVPGTLQGVAAIKASRNPNLTSYAPSVSGDITNLQQGGTRGGLNATSTNNNRTTLIVGIVVGLMALGAIVYFITRKS